MILAGDIGGTHTRLALFNADPHQPLALTVYPSQEHAGLEEIVAAFLAENPADLEGACFDVAGPVRDGRVKTTNLPWIVDARRVAERVGLRSVELVNDLVATAYGIGELKTSDLETLNSGDPSIGGNLAVIAAGTGLGEAGLIWDGERYHALASEGSHSDFGPRSDLEVDLYTSLARVDSHVSYERVCSGIGLVAIYRFLRERTRTQEPAWLASAIHDGDAAAAISSAGLTGRDAVCAEALDLMVSIYGAEAGNLALKLLATGGIYIGGGIAPHILPKLRQQSFLDSLAAKGRFRAMLERIPVHVILNEHAGLFGAARIARREPPHIHRAEARQ
ncbi:MAG: glucokinase [Gaiellaceae bacterium]